MYISETRTVSTAEKEWGKIVKTHPLYCKQLLSMEFNSLLYTVQQILRSSPSGAQITADLTATLFGAYFSISIVHLISFAKEMQYMFPLSQHISCTASTVVQYTTMHPVQYSTLLYTQYSTVHYCTPSTIHYCTPSTVQYTTVHGTSRPSPSQSKSGKRWKNKNIWKTMRARGRRLQHTTYLVLHGIHKQLSQMVR